MIDPDVLSRVRTFKLSKGFYVHHMNVQLHTYLRHHYLTINVKARTLGTEYRMRTYYSA